MPPRKRMRWKQPAPSGSGQPSATSSRGSTGDGHSAVGRTIQLESSDASHLAANWCYIEDALPYRVSGN